MGRRDSIDVEFPMGAPKAPWGVLASKVIHHRSFYWRLQRTLHNARPRAWFGSNPPITVFNRHFYKLFSFDKEKIIQTQYFAGLLRLYPGPPGHLSTDGRDAILPLKTQKNCVYLP